MTKTHTPEPQCVDAADHTLEAERLRRRTCTKPADLRGALQQLLEARALAGEASKPGGYRMTACPTPAAKPARNHLPNRRPAETIAFDRDGSHYQLTIGFYPDGRVGEIFLGADRSDSLLDGLMHDAAILASLALQHGCPLNTITHALKRDARGQAASPIGAALDRISP